MKETTRKSVPRSRVESLANRLAPRSYSASPQWFSYWSWMSRTAFGRPVLWLQRVYTISSARPVTKD